MMITIVVSVSSKAAGEEGPARGLAYSIEGSVEGCPSEVEFRDMVVARLGYDPSSDETVGSILVEIRVADEQLIGRLNTGDAERVLEADRGACGELAQSLALAIALAIDPLAPVEGAPETEQETTTPEEETTVPEERSPGHVPDVAPQTPPTIDVAPTRRLGLEGTAALMVSYGLTPGVSLGGLLQVGITIGSWTLALEGRLDGRVVPRGEGIQAAVYQAGLSPCYRWAFMSFCGVVSLGAAQGRSTDVEEPKVVTGIFSAISVRLMATIDLGDRGGLRILADFSVPLVKATFVVDDQPEWEAPPVYGSLGFGGVIDLF